MWPYWQGKSIGRFSREEASEAAWFQTFLSRLMRRCLPTDYWLETEGTIGTILYSCLFGTPVALRGFEDLVEAIRVLALRNKSRP